ncbi:MAG: hypothetical protein NC402_08100 [Prevotella sp.]|nr:hypothetical protein [Prevotella sp.]MCM1075627.1 hypothetical protein [Ruminococcus sp.]
MKKILSLVCGFAALMFASCASDEPVAPDNGNNTVGDDEKVYASLTLRLPSSEGVRSNDGTEFGKDYENNVGKILVVLAKKNEQGRFTRLAAAESDAMLTDGQTAANEVKYTLNFNAKDFKNNPLTNPNSPVPGADDVYVFAFCNPTTFVHDRYFNNTSEFVLDNITGDLNNGTESEIWRNNQFLMTNCEISQPVKIASREDLVNKHNVPEKALDLGTVKVKRVCARFDYATSTTTVGVNKFEVKSLDGTGNIGVVELTDMAMFNVQKDFYYLPHVANSWLWGEPSDGGVLDYTLCGDLEGYVMSANTDCFKNTMSSADDDAHFFSKLVNNDLAMTDHVGGDNLNWVSIRDKDWNNNHDSDNDEGWVETDASGNVMSTKNNYRIWRYVTENTIPQLKEGTATKSQRYGITTGVVFKAEFTPNDKNVWNGNVIYVHNNIVYGDFNALKEYVNNNPDTKVAQDFAKVNNFKKDAPLTENLLDGINNNSSLKIYS